MYKVGDEELETEKMLIIYHGTTRKQCGLAVEKQMQFQDASSELFPITGQY